MVRGVHGAEDLARTSARLVEAAAAESTVRKESGASLAVVTECLGHAAASVTPPTEAHVALTQLSRRRTNA